MLQVSPSTLFLRILQGPPASDFSGSIPKGRGERLVEGVVVFFPFKAERFTKDT